MDDYEIDLTYHRGRLMPWLAMPMKNGEGFQEAGYGGMSRLIIAAFTERGALRAAQRRIDRDIKDTRKREKRGAQARHDKLTRDRRVPYPGPDKQ